MWQPMKIARIFLLVLDSDVIFKISFNYRVFQMIDFSFILKYLNLY